MCEASFPNSIDFSCGFQLNLSAGTRSRHLRVVAASCFISAIRAEAMLFDVAAGLVLILVVSLSLIEGFGYYSTMLHKCNSGSHCLLSTSGAAGPFLTTA